MVEGLLQQKLSTLVIKLIKQKEWNKNKKKTIAL